MLRSSNLEPVVSAAQIAGLGGTVPSVVVTTQLRLTRDDGHSAVFRGNYIACTNDKALDMSVLGRDILDMFALIIDRPANVVTLLGGQHRYTIHAS